MLFFSLCTFVCFYLQALWAPGSQAVFFIGWYHEPFRLGLKFCSNRRLESCFKCAYRNSKMTLKLVNVFRH